MFNNLHYFAYMMTRGLLRLLQLLLQQLSKLLQEMRNQSAIDSLLSLSQFLLVILRKPKNKQQGMKTELSSTLGKADRKVFNLCIGHFNTTHKIALFFFPPSVIIINENQKGGPTVTIQILKLFLVTLVSSVIMGHFLLQMVKNSEILLFEDVTWNRQRPFLRTGLQDYLL